MSIKSLRARAAAALRRASKNASTRVEAARPQSWKIETLEPKLLLSADALPAVHLMASQGEATALKVYDFQRGEGAAWVDARAAGDDAGGLLQLGAGIAPADVALRRVVDDATGQADALELALRGTADRVQIRGFFTAANPVQAVAFADGTRWSADELPGLIETGPQRQALAAGANAAGDAGATYDATTGFNTTSNPAGAWSYGYSALGGAGYALTPFDLPSGSGWNKSGYMTSGTPAVWKNTGASAQYGVGPGQLSLHPGPTANGDYAILRFTAPADGLYKVTGQFFAGDSGSMSGSVVLNGNLFQPLQHFASTTDASVFSFAPVQMTSGATLDFVVGNNGSFYSGNTPLSVVVESVAVVEPTVGTILSPTAGNNLYLFGRGDGATTVQSYSDPNLGKVNTLQFKSGVLPADVSVARAVDAQAGGTVALALRINGTTDVISFNGFLYGGTPANEFNGLQKVTFADGTVWDISHLLFLLGMGTAGNDSYSGGTGADLLNGGAGNDSLSGAGGNDSLYGGAGNDSLDGSSGDDFLEGGTGDDTLNAGAGSNTFLFGRGDGSDRLYYNHNGGQARVNTLQFKAGVLPADVVLRQVYDNYFGGNRALELSIAGTTDKVTVNAFFYNDDPANAYAGIQRVRFADGTEWTANQMVTMLLAGTAGDDSLRGTSAADTINGGAGNDSLNGAAGDDVVSGGPGNDSVSGEAGADQLLGGDGDDNLDGGEGNDTLEGGAGNDTLNAGAGSNTFVFGRGDGQDRLYYNHNGGQARTNVIVFKAGIAPGDIVLRQAYDNYFGGNRALELSIAGTTDKVTVNAFFYNDDPANAYNGAQRVRFADGTEWDAAAIVNMLFAGTDGNDDLRGTSGADVMNGGAGNDTLNGAGGADVISGGPGNDSLIGEAGADSLQGDAGDDSLDGGEGDDTLEGGVGNDTLNAGAGSNTFVFGRGDGQDRLYYNHNGGQARINTLQFKAGVLPADVIVRQAYDNYFGGNRALELAIAGTTDKVSVNAFFYNDDPANNYNGLQRVRFDDGTEWDIAAILARLYIGTDGDDVWRGTNAAETFSGGLGNDSISGAGGNDLIDGGPGNDSLAGEDGEDTLTGGTGNDSLSGGVGKDLLQGGEGDDSLDGGDGDDTLDGGAGNDSFNAGYGSNTFLFGRGDGQDRLYFNHNGGQARINTLQFKAGVAPADVIVRQAYDNYFGGNNNALELSIAGTTDKVTVNAFFYSDNPANNYNGLQKVRFDDGTEWDIAALLAKVQTFTDGDDNVRGTIADEVLNGGLGNDSIAGAAGNDTIDGGPGNDNLSGDDGDDTVTGGTGNDSVSGGNGTDLLQGGDGNDSVSGGAGNDQIYGGAGDDSLDGGDGDDLMEGGSGNDSFNAGYGNNTFLFGRGDGQDRLYFNHNGGQARINTLQFKAGVAPADVVIRQAYDNYFGGNNNALELSIAGTTDKVTVNAFFYSDNPANNYNGLQKVRFDDGTEWDIAYILATLLAGTAGDDSIAGTSAANEMHGGAGNDSLAGRGGNDVIYGEEGNDALYGEDGADTLVGGAGNDSLDGGTGNNIYIFGRGDGQDSITGRYDPAAGKLNTLQFRADVLPGDVTVRRVYESQSGAVNGLELAIVGSNDRITANYFFNGDDPGNVYNSLQQVTFADGTVWNIARLLELMSAGTPANDNLRGTNGADVLTGGRGDDILNGVAGHDKLYGGDGNDALYGEDGNDTLDGGAGNDWLDGGNGNNVFLFGRGDGQDTVAYGNYDYSGTRLNVIQFKAGVAPTDVTVRRVSGSQGSANEALELAIAGTDDRITANYFLSGDNPNTGYNQLQQVRFDDGTVWSIATLLAALGQGTATEDTLRGTTGADTLSGGRGSDSLYGGAGDDRLNGGEGYDGLVGEDGNDTLDGGAGNDWLDGGNGNNTFLFGRGDGQDTIAYGSYDYSGTRTNTLQFKAGVAPTDVTVRRVSGSQGSANEALELAIIGTDDRVTANYFLSGDNPNTGYNQLQQVKFDDGTVWSIATLLAALGQGTATEDTLRGTTGADTLSGGRGSDSLYGGAGDDRLNGGEGYDGLVGEDGNDTLDGGAGNDWLDGGNGNNTFLFGRGDGQDTVAYGSYDYSGTRVNTIQFKAGVAPTDITVRRVSGSQGSANEALELAIVGTEDRITANYFLSGDNPSTGYNQVQQVKFDDGTVWNLGAILALMTQGTATEDTLRGTTASDTLNGGRGSDSLYGGAGDDRLNGGEGFDGLVGEDGSDTLDGGAGNDYLDGGNGNNIYLFGRGDGQDSIVYSAYDYSGTRLATLQFKAGVLPSDVLLRRVTGSQGGSNEALEVSLIGSDDRVTINYFFSGNNPASGYNPVQQLKFEDGTAWNLAAITARLYTPPDHDRQRHQPGRHADRHCG